MTQITIDQLKQIIEAAIMTAVSPVPIPQLQTLFTEEEGITADAVREIIQLLVDDYRGRGIELHEVASGFRFQSKPELAPWLQRTMVEKPGRLSRALLETLALIAYRQPITRGEIEEVRGVAVSSNIIKTLIEREWIRVIGHRDVPGKPALFATTKAFLNDLNLKSLAELPTLAELRDLEKVAADVGLQLQLDITNDTEKEEQLPESEELVINQDELVETNPSEVPLDASSPSMEEFVSVSDEVEVKLQESLEQEEVAEVDESTVPQDDAYSPLALVEEIE